MFSFKGTVQEWRDSQKLVSMDEEVSRFLMWQRYAVKRNKTWKELDKMMDKIAPRVK
ncbi:MAG: hypothetical protein WCW14_00540 [Candidatus Paceibacterota bacterium]